MLEDLREAAPGAAVFSYLVDDGVFVFIGFEDVVLRAALASVATADAIGLPLVEVIVEDVGLAKTKARVPLFGLLEPVVV